MSVNIARKGNCKRENKMDETEKKQTGKKKTKSEPKETTTHEPQETPKRSVDYCIFQDQKEGTNKLVGSVFNHAKGRGFNILIGKDRYVAFPPKLK